MSLSKSLCLFSVAAFLSVNANAQGIDNELDVESIIKFQGEMEEAAKMGREFGKSQLSKVEQAGEKEPDIEFGQNLDEGEQTALNNLMQTKASERQNSPYQLDPTLLDVQKNVIAARPQGGQQDPLDESSANCIDLSMDNKVSLSLETCETKADYKISHFSCFRSVNTQCDETLQGSLAADQPQIPIAQTGVVLLGAKIDPENAGDPDAMYRVTEAWDTLTTAPETGSRCITTEYNYSVLLPDTRSLTDLSIIVEAYEGSLEFYLGGEKLADMGDIDTCLLSDSDSPLSEFPGASPASSLNILDHIRGIEEKENAPSSAGRILPLRVVLTHPASSKLQFRLDGHGAPFSGSACIDNLPGSWECESQFATTMRPQANLQSESCVQTQTTATANGSEDICVRWQEDYELVKGPLFAVAQQCQAYVDQGCLLVASDCLRKGDGLCDSYKQTYQCSTSIPSENENSDRVQFCNDTFFCNGGDCAKEYQLTSEEDAQAAQADFREASIWMENLKAMDSDTNLQAGEPVFFTGERMSCSRDLTGVIVDCCDDAGIVLNLGIDVCSADQVELARAREDGRTHKVGSKTKVLSKQTVYCVFESEIALQFMREARTVMSGIPNNPNPFGTMKNTNCNGLKVAEVEALDMNKMDFSNRDPDPGNPADMNFLGVSDEISKNDACFSASGICDDNDE